MDTMGKRIAFYRKRKKIKQQELANILNLKSDGTISQWEADTTSPKPAMLLKLCQVLDISISDLFGVKNPDSSTDEIQNIKKNLNEEGQKRLLDYAELLLLKYKK